MPDDKQTPLIPILWQSDQMRSVPGGRLPAGEVLDAASRIRIAVDEGYHPVAVGEAYGRRESGWNDTIRISVCALVAGLLLFFLFPFDRFFKQQPRSIGALRIDSRTGGPADFFPADRAAPQSEVLQKIDRLYLEKGRLTEAIAAAEEALEKLPANERRRWPALYYRYWQLLADAGRFERLTGSTGDFLKILPEDPVAAYFLARGFYADTRRQRPFTPRRVAELRAEAEAVDGVLVRCIAALRARMHSGSRPRQAGELADIAAKLQLERARLLSLMWEMGGFKEDDHPDVRLRDEALDILDSQALAGMKEALALKRDIYYEILLRWHWIEGSEPIQKRMVPRSSVEAELRKLDRLLGKAADK